MYGHVQVCSFHSIRSHLHRAITHKIEMPSTMYGGKIKSIQLHLITNSCYSAHCDTVKHTHTQLIHTQNVGHVSNQNCEFNANQRGESGYIIAGVIVIALVCNL